MFSALTIISSDRSVAQDVLYFFSLGSSFGSSTLTSALGQNLKKESLETSNFHNSTEQHSATLMRHL